MAVARAKTWSASKRLITEVAILGTAFLHLLFFYLVKLQSPSLPLPVEARPPSCFLLNVAVPDSDWTKTIGVWLDLEQPTLFSLPNYIRGFSLIFPEALLPYSSESGNEAGIAAGSGIVFPALPLANAIPALPEHLQRSYRTLSPSLVERPLPVVLPHTVIWRFENGTLLTGIAEIPETELKEALSLGMVQNTTRFKAMVSSGVPTRLYLVQSSGNAALDRLALQRLSAKLLDWERFLISGQKTPELERFVAAGNTSLVIEAEWRLVAEKL